MTGAETTQWLRDWTGNEAVSESPFCVFGEDGTGGYAAFWLIRAGRSVEEQPIVFLGSEGETGVVAGSLSEFLWLLADGFGPYEAVECEGWSSEPTPGLSAIAERYATPPKRTGAKVIASARSEFPDFVSTIQALAR